MSLDKYLLSQELSFWKTSNTPYKWVSAFPPNNKDQSITTRTLTKSQSLTVITSPVELGSNHSKNHLSLSIELRRDWFPISPLSTRVALMHLQMPFPGIITMTRAYLRSEIILPPLWLVHLGVVIKMDPRMRSKVIIEQDGDNQNRASKPAFETCCWLFTYQASLLSLLLKSKYFVEIWRIELWSFLSQT